MLEQAVGIPHGLRIAGMPAVANHADLVEVMRIPRLSLHPSPSGAQHCEIAGMRDAREERVSPSWVPNWVRKWARGKSWEEQDREIKPNATVHPSVDERFAVEAAIQCDGIKPYRPAPLAGHQQFRGFYRTVTNTFPASGSS